MKHFFKGFSCALLCFLFGIFPLTGCEPPVTESSNAASSDLTVPSMNESSAEEQVSAGQNIILLYTDYITVSAHQDGISYEYTYCFNKEHCVFNAIAAITFSSEEDAKKEYRTLAEQEYPNLQLDGTRLSFSFPRKECPYYGISYQALSILLQETIYEITDYHAPEESAPSQDASGNE